MNKKEILQNALILPLVFGVAFAIAFCVFMGFNIDGLLPVPNDTVFAYHDVIEENDEKPKLDNLTKNDNIGAISFGNTGLTLRYEANYSSLVGSVSMVDGSKPLDEIGATYLEATSGNAKEIEKAGRMKINSLYGDFEYRLADKKSFNNRLDVIGYSPRMSKCVIVFYQNSNGNGLTSEYNALVFEEVHNGA